MRILLVDDSVRHRRAGIKDLTVLGHEVTAVGSYTDALRLAREQTFDVALIDMLMPAEAQTLGPAAIEQFLGAEIGIGFPMLMKLALCGVKKVAMATDTNHHAHPMSAAVDWFNGAELSINGARAFILHTQLRSDGAKDWARVLSSFD